MAAINYITMILHSIMMVNMLFRSITRAKASAERINEVMDTEPVIKDGTGVTEDNINNEYCIEFENVSFDTMLACYLLNYNIKEDISYISNAKGYNIEFYTNLIKKGEVLDKGIFLNNLALKSKFIYDTREEYIKFFFATTETTLDEYYDDLFFDKIRKELDEETREFWEYLFNYNDWYDIYNSTLFSSEMVFETSALEQNKYLEKDEYYKLKEILKNININYIESDLMDLKIEDNYDLIYLSNIINYVKKNAYLEKIDEFSEKSKGIIVSYIFGELDRALKIFRGDFSYREFDSGSGIIINKGKQNIKK